MGRREEGSLCDPGSELLLGGSAKKSNARIINAVEKKENETKRENIKGGGAYHKPETQDKAIRLAIACARPKIGPYVVTPCS